jgi:FkbM family methyltransferase
MDTKCAEFILSPLDVIELPSDKLNVAENIVNAWVNYSLNIDVVEYNNSLQDIPKGDYLKIILGLVLIHRGEFDDHEGLLDEGLKSCTSEGLKKALLMSSSYRLLANSYLLQKKEHKAKAHYQMATVILKALGTEMVGLNVFNAKARLGLLDEGCQDIENQFRHLLQGIDSSSDIADSLTVIHSELELLRHELTIAQQKSQLYLLPQGQDNDIDYSQTSVFKKALAAYSPSQLGQDLWILEQHSFKRDGFFVEFGATDGVLLSNSYLLEKYFGWQGLCAEPNPTFYEKLKKNRNCTVSSDCISANSGNKVEFIFADEYGGISNYSDEDSHADKRQAYKNKHGAVELVTVSLDDFLKQHSAPHKIDYMSIDTEGSEFDILNAFPFDDWDISCLTVEHNFSSTRDKIYNLLKSKGYKRVEAQFDDWYYRD